MANYAAFYYPNWAIYARKVFPKDIPHTHITTIIHAFWGLALVDDSDALYAIKTLDVWADFDMCFSPEQSVQCSERAGNCKGIFGEYAQMKALANNENRTLNIGLSVGGWTRSGLFSQALSRSDSRQSVVKSVIDTFKQYSFFSIIDFDWEYLSGDGHNYGNDGNGASEADPANFITFLQLLRQELCANDMSHVKINYCIGSNKQIVKSYNIVEVARHVDCIHGMLGYDQSAFASDKNPDGSATSRFHTNLFANEQCTGSHSVDEMVHFLLNLGIPASKLTIGIAGYSRGYSGTDGIGQLATAGSVDQSWEQGICDYKTLPRPNATEHYDEVACAHWSYDADTRTVNTYDGVDSVRAKCQYVRKHNLRGIIMWEVTGDVPFDHPRSLVRVVHDELLQAC